MLGEPAFDRGDFPASDLDAQERFEQWREKDPFPEIPPALMNTADLLDYVATAGIIYPFPGDPLDAARTLKPASCAIPMEGPYLYWTSPADPNKPDRPKRVENELRAGERLLLEKNSIVYLSLAPQFRMPHYIAARYNLQIRQVYRGLLVGTGPLVDPGFVGRLSIPLHNLTNNEYEISAGELLVWMEFTKLSPNWRWDPDLDKRRTNARYVPFPESKKRRRTIGDYVAEASDRPIRSSIPVLVERSAHDAANAAASARSIGERVRNLSIAAVAAVVVATGALIFGGYTVVQSAQSTDDSVRSTVRSLEHQMFEQQRTLSEQARLLHALRLHPRAVR